MPGDDPAKPEKIAILGGGTGALAAAFGLTEAPDWKSRYEITVYQVGWRLGGKGASGRNQERQNRIEEHGLHVWAGFYENAFRMLQTCYAELNRPADWPLATWQDAFKPHNFITMEEFVDGRWINWNIDLPASDSVPGQEPLPTPWNLFQLLVDWMIHRLTASNYVGVAPVPAVLPPIAPAPRPDWLHQLVQLAEGLISHEAILIESAVRATLPIVHLHAVKTLMESAPHVIEEQSAALHHGVIWLLREFRGLLGHVLRDRFTTDDEARRLWTILDLACTTLIGLLADGILFHGFFSIDHWEWKSWLEHHGASPETLTSAPVRATYDYIFGFEGGDTSKPSVAAGTVTQGLMRLALTAKGAIFWEMQAGMGDTVVSPLYLVLKKRGVKFRFFHRVRSLGVEKTPEGTYGDTIDRIALGRQATLKPGLPDGEYQPLVNVNDLACWPSAPLYDQLEEGAVLRQGDRP